MEIFAFVLPPELHVASNHFLEIRDVISYVTNLVNSRRENRTLNFLPTHSFLRNRQKLVEVPASQCNHIGGPGLL